MTHGFVHGALKGGVVYGGTTPKPVNLLAKAPIPNHGSVRRPWCRVGPVRAQLELVRPSPASWNSSAPSHHGPARELVRMRACFKPRPKTSSFSLNLCLRARSLAGAVCIPQIVPSQSIELAQNKTVDGPQLRASATRVSIVIALPEESPPPGEFSSNRSRTEPRTRDARLNGTLPFPRSPARHRDGKNPSPLSSSSSVRHHPLTQDSHLPLPCRTWVGLPPAPTCGTLPECGDSIT